LARTQASSRYRQRQARNLNSLRLPKAFF
jgi:hypothetical protein